ncbi:MAG: DNA replication/repair protein RecF [Pseudomonadota bacterium]|nr:DNA replication/repair protein RecF [Pseudomonadota bacterium]MDE3037301.1 DNA replication/repair protein RecF [Pseudomonadota bacterium]
MSHNPASREAATQDPVQSQDPVLTLFAKAESAPRDVLSISSLSLHCFRNYASAHIEISPAPVVLTGRNGAGKTNILEAISLLTPGRGLRRARVSELNHRPHPDLLPVGKGDAPVEDVWAVSANITGMQGSVQIGTGRDPEAETDKRIVKMDGKTARSQAELARHLAMIWLTPQMEQLFNDGTSAGRRFFDRLVYSFDAEHASRINEYDFAMRERNKLLADNRADAAWLEALEATMAETGAAIASARLLACDHINHTIAASTLSFPKAQLEIHGAIENGLAGGETAVTIEEWFKKKLREHRGRDAAAGRALDGAHRSSLCVTHIEKSMPAERCSTGEQKALLLSIVLAQAQSGAKWHGVVPVLLLDEVAAHLDATRRLELFEEICQIGAQVWMTGTDPLLFEGMQGKAQFLRVENGSVVPAQAGIRY